jgi:hypothetical protein
MSQILRMKNIVFLVVFFLTATVITAVEPIDFGKLRSPVLLEGNEKTAYRDPAVTYHQGMFYLFGTKSSVEENNNIFIYTFQSTSTDLQHWGSVF